MNLSLLKSVGHPEYVFLIAMVGACEGTPYYFSICQVSVYIPPANIPLTKESQVSKPKVMDWKIYSHGHSRV